MSGSAEVERPSTFTNGVGSSKLSDTFVDAGLSRIGSLTTSQSGLKASDVRSPARTNDGGDVYPPNHVKISVEDGRYTARADVQSITSSRLGETPVVRANSPVSEEEQPEAGPSNPYRNSRRSLRLGNSTTSFLDVTDSISNISEYPVSGGGHCDVHTADMVGEGLVALKKLRLFENSEKAKSRFRYEAEIWIRLEHPNVLRFFGICQIGPTMYMVSPWQGNSHMLTYFASHPEANRLDFVTQVADALAFLYSNDPKIVHGDIKGQNVLVSDRGEALLCDFGLSMVLSEMAIISGVPTGVQYGGSIRWLAPEIMQGSEVKTEASDVFSFALLVVEAFSGTVPFSELKIDAAVINAVLSGKRPENPFRSGIIEEERLWRLLQLCWHQAVVVRPPMGQVQAIMHSLRTENKGMENSKWDLSPILIGYVLKGNCSLDEYIEKVKSAKMPGHSFTVSDLEDPPMPTGFMTSVSRTKRRVQALLGLHILVYLLSVCALALNIVLLSYFQKGSSLVFRHVAPVFGFVTWAWLLGVAEPWFVLNYWRLLFGLQVWSSRTSLYASWACKVFSALLCLTNAILVLIVTLSPSFARDRPANVRFDKLLHAFNVLCVLVTVLAQFDLLWQVWRINRWRITRWRRGQLVPSTRPISPIPPINTGKDKEEDWRKFRLQDKSEYEPQNRQLPGTSENLSASNEEEIQIGLSAKQKGKQRAV